jgi:2-polyprenyl-3-methyl-5-hydroxy-6-metoxy-1,4-benzoquinol methylase
VFTKALPATQAETHDYSSYYDESNLVVPDFVERRLDELVAGFDRFRERNRWLDVGCGAGALLRAASRRGWDVVGTEVAADAVEAIRDRGFDARLGELESLALEPGGFDVVSAVEVLEHVPDPRRLLATAAGLIRLGGALYLTTPHGRGISARLLKTRWSVVSPPEHLQLFSIDGLRQALRAAGLEVLTVRAHAVDPRELIGGLRGNAPAAGGERVASAYELNEAMVGSRSGRLAKAAANASLSALRLGDTLKVTARKPA